MKGPICAFHRTIACPARAPHCAGLGYFVDTRRPSRENVVSEVEGEAEDGAGSADVCARNQKPFHFGRLFPTPALRRLGVDPRRHHRPLALVQVPAVDVEVDDEGQGDLLRTLEDVEGGLVANPVTAIVLSRSARPSNVRCLA